MGIRLQLPWLKLCCISNRFLRRALAGEEGESTVCRELPLPPASAKEGLSNCPAQLQPVWLGTSHLCHAPAGTSGTGQEQDQLQTALERCSHGVTSRAILRLGKAPPVLQLETVFLQAGGLDGPASRNPLARTGARDSKYSLHPLPYSSSSARREVAINSCLLLQQNKTHSQIILKSPGAASGARRVL